MPLSAASPLSSDENHRRLLFCTTDDDEMTGPAIVVMGRDGNADAGLLFDTVHLESSNWERLEVDKAAAVTLGRAMRTAVAPSIMVSNNGGWSVERGEELGN